MDNSREILVSVMLNGETVSVGKLWCYFRKGRTSAAFEYDKIWLSNLNRFALEPALHLTEGAFYTDKALFGAIGDSAPDRWGRILMRRANTSGRTLSEIDYLLGVNDETRQGALRFSETLNSPYLAKSDKKSIPPLVKLPELLSASENFLADSESAEELRLLLVPGSSLGGARPKASVYDKDGSLAIAKFPRKDDDTDIVRWEAVALTLAKTAGINVPLWRLEEIIGKHTLIIKRFDRDGQKRIPFLSAMSMMNANDNDGLVHSFVEIANNLIQYGTQPDKDLEELWRRMVFGIMISNTDNHLRNHGFLYFDNGWVLSPVYDLNPNIDRSDFSVSVDETGVKSTIELAMKTIDNFRLSKTQAKVIFDEIKSAVADWRKIAKSYGITENEINRMKNAFIV
ncbi:MAG: type II toxin-antitoxin system HipA family toxin [Treponema sp.]|nr:type II toxin-antitoxin system HipA family toxin [Treponema sp.]